MGALAQIQVDEGIGLREVIATCWRSGRAQSDNHLQPALPQAGAQAANPGLQAGVWGLAPGWGL